MTYYSFVRTIVEDPDRPGEFIVDFGEDLCNHLGWKPGDQIEWRDNKDGTWTIKKASSSN